MPSSVSLQQYILNLINMIQLKALPVPAEIGREGPRSLRLPGYSDNQHVKWYVVSPTHRPPLRPREDSWYSLLLRLSQTQDHISFERITSMKNLNDPIGRRTCDFPACTVCDEITLQEYNVCRIKSQPYWYNIHYSSNSM
jgi:hypothetical protein